MKQVKFSIKEFKSPSGGFVFRVEGRIAGTRIRKKLTTRADAEVECQTLKIRSLQRETGIRTTATRLTEVQLKETEAIYARLASLP
jgi:hypothetical protein